jgi:hypothetical protein
MADVDKILRLVAEGALTADEADQFLAALSEAGASAEAGRAEPSQGEAAGERARHLRIQISERGRQVVNLRVPINIAGFAAGFVPGLPEEQAERIRSSIRAGSRGTIVDITDEDGDRVLIVSE